MSSILFALKTVSNWLMASLAITLIAFHGPALSQTLDKTSTIDAETLQGPALWRVKDDDTEIILFGTIHLLPEGLDWQRPELTSALSSAKYLYLEVDGEAIDPQDQATFNQASFAETGKFLSDILSVEEQAKLVKSVEGLNLNLQGLNQREPWFVSLIIGQMLLEKNGYLAAYGAEAWLSRQAYLQNTPIRSLETMSDVALPLSALPMETQRALLLSTLDEANTVESLYDVSINAWLAGETETLDAVTMKDMRTKLPTVYKVMLEDRNRNWLAKVEGLLKTEHGKILIAVGSGHLVGPVSLVEMLRENGWTVERF